MASVNLGKVGLLLRGDWDSDTDYAALDVVSHEGYSYAARVANKNVEPSAETAAYWQPLAESASVLATMLGYKNDAADSATAAAGSATAAATSASSATDALANEAADFSSSNAYAIGDYVIYNNGTHKYLYRFTAAHSAGAWVGTDAVQVALADDVSDLKSALNVNHTFGFPITTDMFELGRIDITSGDPVAATNRSRTKDFIPVRKGDTIIVKRDTSSNNGVQIFFYDTTKTYINYTSTWLDFKTSWDYPIVAQDGYIKAIGDNANATIFNNAICISRTSESKIATLALEGNLNTTILPIPLTAFDNGYWTNVSGTFKRQNSATRIATVNSIWMYKGDEIHLTSKNFFYVSYYYHRVGETTAEFIESFVNVPFKMPYDGYAYISIRNADDTEIVDKTVYDKAFTIKRATDIGLVEHISSTDLYNGYIKSDGTITNHAERLVNWNPVHCNKGDRIRLNYMDLMVSPHEFDIRGTQVATVTNYVTPVWVGGVYQDCGDYIVQNDNVWVYCTVASIGETPANFTPANYDNLFSVIHIPKNRELNTAENTMFNFPKSARKGTKLSTSAIVSQGATIVNGKLWAAIDNSGTYSIQVINLETGAIEKTITHNLGHCNCLDYCAETDTLMTVDSRDYLTILLLPNASDVTTTIEKTDCIAITVSETGLDKFGACCFGQDSREVFMFCGAESSTAQFNLYRGVLGYTNSAYDGTITISKTYSGLIRDNVDTYVTPGTAGYAQDCCYDGYFYLAYGTSGHNFLVIDIDDKNNTYCVVGNYLHHEYKDDRTEYGVEPEGVCLHDGKIYCLSRQNTIHASYFNVFDR